jgi:hypothetical protein
MLFIGHRLWRGESGKLYRFKITLTKNGLPDGAGIYVFVRRRFVVFLEPLYVGKAASLRGRLLGHEKWGRAFWFYGATERHIMEIEEERDRVRIEEDLVRGLKPRMNDQMVPRSARDLPKDPTLRKTWYDRNWMSIWLGGGRRKAAAR